MISSLLVKSCNCPYFLITAPSPVRPFTAFYISGTKLHINLSHLLLTLNIILIHFSHAAVTGCCNVSKRIRSYFLTFLFCRLRNQIAHFLTVLWLPWSLADCVSLSVLEYDYIILPDRWSISCCTICASQPFSFIFCFFQLKSKYSTSIS